MSKVLRLAAAGIAVMAVSACAPLPPDYAPHYVQVPVESQKHPGRVTYVLVPEACLNPDLSDTGLGGPRLPPGCANNANLLAMVEKKKDLVAGRPLGPGQGGPPARAADAYLSASPGSGTPFSTSIQNPAPASKTEESVPTPSSPAIPK